jgi:molybdopterin synthase sulfur carrier subunit
MPKVTFTDTLQRHVACPPTEAAGTTVREVLDRVFEEYPRVRGYVLNEQGELRKHMAIFLNGAMIRDKVGLSDAVESDTELYVMQALSGG